MLTLWWTFAKLNIAAALRVSAAIMLVGAALVALLPADRFSTLTIGSGIVCGLVVFSSCWRNFNANHSWLVLAPFSRLRILWLAYSSRAFIFLLAAVACTVTATSVFTLDHVVHREVYDRIEKTAKAMPPKPVVQNEKEMEPPLLGKSVLPYGFVLLVMVHLFLSLPLQDRKVGARINWKATMPQQLRGYVLLAILFAALINLVNPPFGYNPWLNFICLIVIVSWIHFGVNAMSFMLPKKAKRRFMWINAALVATICVAGLITIRP